MITRAAKPSMTLSSCHQKIVHDENTSNWHPMIDNTYAGPSALYGLWWLIPTCSFRARKAGRKLSVTMRHRLTTEGSTASTSTSHRNISSWTSSATPSVRGMLSSHQVLNLNTRRFLPCGNTIMSPLSLRSTLYIYMWSLGVWRYQERYQAFYFRVARFSGGAAQTERSSTHGVQLQRPPPPCLVSRLLMIIPSNLSEFTASRPWHDGLTFESIFTRCPVSRNLLLSTSSQRPVPSDPDDCDWQWIMSPYCKIMHKIRSDQSQLPWKMAIRGGINDVKKMKWHGLTAKKYGFPRGCLPLQWSIGSPAITIYNLLIYSRMQFDIPMAFDNVDFFHTTNNQLSAQLFPSIYMSDQVGPASLIRLP